jgi:hypothetical protein
MGIFAVISLLDCFFKFVAVAILFFINVDNLVVYSVFLALISLVGLSLYILIIEENTKNVGTQNQIISNLEITCFHFPDGHYLHR